MKDPAPTLAPRDDESAHLRAMLTRERARYRRRKARDGAKLVQRTMELVAAREQARAAETILARVAVLAGERCRTYTQNMTCADNPGRTPDARYLADRYCDPCRLRHALTGGPAPTKTTPGRHTL